MATQTKIKMQRFNGTDYDQLLPATTIEQVDGLQTALNAKQATITGGASTITSSNLTASRALISDGNGKVAASAVTSTELGYIDGVTSNVQTQLNAKQATVTGAATTITGSNLTANRALISNGSGKVAVSDVTSTELAYLDGVTSNVQTQINAKYTKPSGGIPKTDLASAVQTSLGKADGSVLYTASQSLTDTQKELARTNIYAADYATQLKVSGVLYDNAGAHNSIYRGKNLGTSVTSEQYDAIDAGTFDDMYIGDYWEINDTRYIIAAFNYYYGSGQPSITGKNHVVIVPNHYVPDAMVYMNSTDTTEGGYANSWMRNTGLNDSKTKINNDFGEDHIWVYRAPLCNAVTNGAESGWAWYSCTVELMSEVQLYGTYVFANHSRSLGQVDQQSLAVPGQFPLYALSHQRILSWTFGWLRDVVSSTSFASFWYQGNTGYSKATTTRRRRPYFCIVKSNS